MKQPEPDESRTARQALGLALRTMHQLSGRTLRAVERDVSVSDSTLSRYFRGQAVPPWPTVETICGALGSDPASVRRLWTAATAEKSGAQPEQAATVAGESVLRPPAGRGRWAVLAGDRRVWLAAGLLAGLAVGLPLGALLTDRDPAQAAADRPPTASAVVPAPHADGTDCPWKYVVTDGEPNDVLVFDNPRRASIIARYAPRQVFYAPSPPVVVDHMMRTADGWVAQGEWLRRYTGAPCHRGGS